jgi:hypothetical protein
MFGLGSRPPDEGSPDAALLGGLQRDQLAVITELYALTDQAGILAMELLRSGRCLGTKAASTSIQYDLRAPYEAWLIMLLHLEPVLTQCWAKGPDGKTTFATPLLGENEGAVWIDNYPQACLSALAWLKVKADHSPILGRQRISKKSASLRNEDRDAWVARQRAKKKPRPWEEIYDEGVERAQKKGWDMPGSAKALAEAHRRYLERQRREGKD